MRDPELDLVVIMIQLATPPVSAPEIRIKKILHRRPAARTRATGEGSADECDLGDPVPGRRHGIEATQTVTTPGEGDRSLVPDCLPCPTPRHE